MQVCVLVKSILYPPRSEREERERRQGLQVNAEAQKMRFQKRRSFRFVEGAVLERLVEIFEDDLMIINLARGFAGECQAGMRYQLTAKAAMREADLFFFRIDQLAHRGCKQSEIILFVRSLAHDRQHVSREQRGIAVQCAKDWRRWRIQCVRLRKTKPIMRGFSLRRF